MVKREEGALLQSIVLDREGEHGLSVQICAGLRELILGGQMPRERQRSLAHPAVAGHCVSRTRRSPKSRGAKCATSGAVSASFCTPSTVSLKNFGSCVVAGLFTLLPGRLLGDLLWQQLA